MLLGENTSGQRLTGVVRHDGNHRLVQDGTVVEMGGDMVHGSTCEAAARLEGARVGAQAGKGRQQRGVDIDKTPVVASMRMKPASTTSAGWWRSMTSASWTSNASRVSKSR